MNLDGVKAHGNTDVGILRDALQLAGLPDIAWRRHLPEILQTLGRNVHDRRNEMDVTTLPAVTDVLDHLRSCGAVLGVATGNLEAIGTLKLARCGLLSYFRFATYSDEHEYRRDVFRAAVVEAKAIAGANAAVCVIGDTPADVQAAHDVGVEAMAVATGIYSFDTLAAERPARCLRSLADLLFAC